MSVYKTIIRPVVTYGSETWMMNTTHDEKLKSFERKILKSIYGPVQDTNNEWLVRTNDDDDDGSETWMMNTTHEEKLKIFERKILRSIHRPVQDTKNEWRVRTNQEIEALIKEENIVRFIKSQRLAWYGHVNRMEDNKNVKVIMRWNPFDRRSRGRPKTRWKNDVEADLRAMKIMNWRTRIEDKLAWKKIVEQAKTHPGL
jgi:hypothetical protein